MRKWENKSLSVKQWSTSECVHIISNQHQAVPYRYQHIITASTHTLNHNRRRNPLLSVSLPATHTHTHTLVPMKPDLYHPFEFCAASRFSSSFLCRYNLFRDTAKTIVSGVKHSLLVSISAVWVKKFPHITCLSVKAFKYVLGFLLVTALTSAVFQSDGWHLL